jgi:hypothetical protein
MAVVIAQNDPLGGSRLERSPGNFRFINIPGYVTEDVRHPEGNIKNKELMNDLRQSSATSMLSVMINSIDRPTAMVIAYPLQSEDHVGQVRIVHVKDQLLEVCKTVLYTHSNAFEDYTKPIEERSLDGARKSKLAMEIDSDDDDEEDDSNAVFKRSRSIVRALKQNTSQANGMFFSTIRDDEEWSRLNGNLSSNTIMKRDNACKLMHRDTEFTYVGGYYVGVVYRIEDIEKVVNWKVFSKPDDFIGRLQNHFSNKDLFPHNRYFYVVAQCIEDPKSSNPNHQQGFAITYPWKIATSLGAIATEFYFPTSLYSLIQKEDPKDQFYDYHCVGILPRVTKYAPLTKCKFYVPFTLPELSEEDYQKYSNGHTVIRLQQVNKYGRLLEVSETTTGQAAPNYLIATMKDDDDSIFPTTTSVQKKSNIVGVCVASFIAMMAAPALSTNKKVAKGYFNGCDTSSMFGNHYILGTKISGCYALRQNLVWTSEAGQLDTILKLISSAQPAAYEEIDKYESINDNYDGKMDENGNKTLGGVDAADLGDLSAMFDQLVTAMEEENPEAKVFVIGNQLNSDLSTMDPEAAEFYLKNVERLDAQQTSMFT